MYVGFINLSSTVDSKIIFFTLPISSALSNSIEFFLQKFNKVFLSFKSFELIEL